MALIFTNEGRPRGNTFQFGNKLESEKYSSKSYWLKIECLMKLNISYYLEPQRKKKSISLQSPFIN